MNGLATRPTEHHLTELRAGARRPRLLVGLTGLLETQADLVGARGQRLLLAMRAGLRVPAGSIITAAALGYIDPQLDPDRRSSADAIHETFETIGQSGRLPLMVSVSSVASPKSAGDRTVAVRDVTSCAELLHTVRRLSATASVLGDTIAVIIQLDIDATTTGTLTSSRNPQRIASSITSTGPDVNVTELVDLGQRVADVFPDEHHISWATDKHGRIWIIDIDIGSARAQPLSTTEPSRASQST